MIAVRERTCPPKALGSRCIPPADRCTVAACHVQHALIHLNDLILGSHPTGAGFTGFWYHLGLFERLDHDRGGYDYYCYSSGCLSLVLSFLNTTVDEAYGACHALQTDWRRGNRSRFDLVPALLDRLLAAPRAEVLLRPRLPRLHVLLTSARRGLAVRRPTDAAELRELLLRTTWIPAVTGRGVRRGVGGDGAWGEDDDGDAYLDGGFSRVLHPPCRHTVRVPADWTSFLHGLNPGLGRDAVYELWEMGRRASHPLLEAPTAAGSAAADVL